MRPRLPRSASPSPSSTPSSRSAERIGSSTNSNDDKAIIDLFDADSITLGLVGSFQWNIFNYGRIKSNIRLQDAVFQQQLVDYRETVLEAQGEVENSIVAYLKSQEQVTSYRAAADFAQRAPTSPRLSTTTGWLASIR